jgi:hypothetical protein
MIGGKRYPIRFAGYDQHSFSHRAGCLAHNFGPGPCQCGAHERAGRWYAVKIEPVATDPTPEKPA